MRTYTEQEHCGYHKSEDEHEKREFDHQHQVVSGSHSIRWQS